jgi:hypothetical protein
MIVTIKIRKNVPTEKSAYFCSGVSAKNKRRKGPPRGVRLSHEGMPALPERHSSSLPEDPRVQIRNFSAKCSALADKAATSEFEHHSWRFRPANSCQAPAARIGTGGLISELEPQQNPFRRRVRSLSGSPFALTSNGVHASTIYRIISTY